MHVFSRASSDTCYVEWIKGGADLPSRGRSVIVKGGHGVATKNLLTPLGVHTEVTDEEMEILKANHVFQKHLKIGSVVVQSRKADPEKVLKDMGAPDPSEPLTPEKIAKMNGQKGPKVMK